MARKMKDSGIEWIGEIPEGWNCTQLKFLCKLITDGTHFSPQTIEDGFPYITACDVHGIGLDYKSAKCISEKDFNTLVSQGCQPLKGDVLLVKDGATTGRVGFVSEDVPCVILSSVAMLRPADHVNGHYLMYLLASSLLQHQILVSMAGSAMPRTTLAKLTNYIGLSCPLDEQRKISDYLDAQCSRIDAMLAKTRTSIEEYKRLKQAVITQAVTKGVRSERKMKESGVEWIGKIPKEWNVQRFARVTEIKSNLVSPENYSSFPQVSPENIEKDSGRLLPCKTVGEVGVISWNHLFYKGQILYSKIRPKLNKVCIAPFDGLCSADMYPIETQNNSRYIMYCMLSNIFIQQVSMITENRVKMPKINQNELSRLLVVMPETISEQKEITDYLDDKCAEIDGMIAKKEQLAKELEKYKKSLIYEVVTGKREV